MKKILLILSLTFVLISCNEEPYCNTKCGRVISSINEINLPANGDETTTTTYQTKCGEIKTQVEYWDLTYGLPGSPNQPYRGHYINEYVCFN